MFQLLIVIKTYRISLSEMLLHLHFEYLLKWRKLISNFVRLFVSFCVLSLIEHNPMCYGATGKKNAFETTLYSLSDTSD